MKRIWTSTRGGFWTGCAVDVSMTAWCAIDGIYGRHGNYEIAELMRPINPMLPKNPMKLPPITAPETTCSRSFDRGPNGLLPRRTEPPKRR